MTQTRTANILVIGGETYAIRLAGGNPVGTGYADPRAIDAVTSPSIDGLLLTGGSDVDPTLYYAQPLVTTQTAWMDRDLVEYGTIENAVKRGIPILGICRGMQILNVTLGGDLYQHIPNLADTHRFHNGHTHRVRTARGSRLNRAFRNKDTWVVSIHHQAVHHLGEGLVSTAWASDGIVEGIEGTEGWVVGVQFHPELDLHSLPMRRILNGFVRAAATFAGKPKPKTQVPVYVKKETAVSTTSEYAKLGGGPFDDDSYCDVEQERIWSGQAATRPVVDPATARRILTDRGVRVRWTCFRCRIDFDERADHVDHMLELHGIELADVVPGIRIPVKVKAR